MHSDQAFFAAGGVGILLPWHSVQLLWAGILKRLCGQNTLSLVLAVFPVIE